jgi:hypothetical protein
MPTLRFVLENAETSMAGGIATITEMEQTVQAAP